MIRQGSDIFLKPINNRFKKLIAQHGNHWISISDPVPMICFGNDIGITCFPVTNHSKFSNFRLEDVRNGR